LDEVLLLEPGEQGTSVHVAEDDRQIKSLVTGGLSIAEAAMPKTRPEKAEQLALFGE
jgi:hypothetical protein